MMKADEDSERFKKFMELGSSLSVSTELDTYCPYCDKPVRASIEEVVESYVVRDKPVVITSKVPVCPYCDEIIGDCRTEGANLELAYQKYEDTYGDDPRMQ